MSQIILDMSSGNTCQNDTKIIERMIDEIVSIDTKKHDVVFKWQLFEKAGDNIPLNWGAFNYAYDYAKKKGYQTTASVFDLKSLRYLLGFEIPFIKIANRPDLYWLMGEVKRNIPVYYSYTNNLLHSKEVNKITDVPMICISQYPSTKQAYIDLIESIYKGFDVKRVIAISDHTVDFDLYKKYEPDIYECHYKLPDSTGLDAGSFARTPEQLKEIL